MTSRGYSQEQRTAILFNSQNAFDSRFPSQILRLNAKQIWDNTRD
jgi:hypothetical protein